MKIILKNCAKTKKFFWQFLSLKNWSFCGIYKKLIFWNSLNFLMKINENYQTFDPKFWKDPEKFPFFKTEIKCLFSCWKCFQVQSCIKFKNKSFSFSIFICSNFLLIVVNPHSPSTAAAAAAAMNRMNAWKSRETILNGRIRERRRRFKFLLHGVPILLVWTCLNISIVLSHILSFSNDDEVFKTSFPNKTFNSSPVKYKEKGREQKKWKSKHRIESIQNT